MKKWMSWIICLVMAMSSGAIFAACSSEKGSQGSVSKKLNINFMQNLSAKIDDAKSLGLATDANDHKTYLVKQVTVGAGATPDSLER